MNADVVEVEILFVCYLKKYHGLTAQFETLTIKRVGDTFTSVLNYIRKWSRTLMILPRHMESNTYTDN